MRARAASLRCSGKGNRALLTLAFTAKVAASPRRVWRVLTSPAVSSHWLPAHEGWLGPPPMRFTAGEPLRFRTRLHRVPMSGEIRVLELRPGRARVQLRFGLFACEARFSLGPEPGVEGAARVGLLLHVANQLALVGGSLDRFEVRRLACELAEQTLAALTSVAEELESAARRAAVVSS